LKKSADRRINEKLADRHTLLTRRSGVQCPRGVFSECFALFCAQENAGKTPQHTYFKKKRGKIEKKTAKIMKSENHTRENLPANGAHRDLRAAQPVRG